MTDSRITPIASQAKSNHANSSAASRATLRLRIEGMTCGGCVRSVEKALQAVPGVARAVVNLPTEIAMIEMASPPAKRDVLIQAVRAAGYDADTVRAGAGGFAALERTAETRLREHRQALVYAVGLSTPILALHFMKGFLMSADHGGSVWPLAMEAMLSLVLLASPAAAPILASGLQALLHRTGSMDLLISLGVVTAFLGGVGGLLTGSHDMAHFHAVAMIIPVVCLGKYLEVRARRDAISGLTHIASLIPERAMFITADGDREVSALQLEAGDRVRVMEHMLIPVDGRVVEGSAAVDESLLTGEPLPKPRSVGEDVAAGTMVVEGQLVIETIRTGQEASVGKIARMVEEAQASPVPLQRVADTVAGWLVPIVCGLAAITFVAHAFSSSTGVGVGIYRAVAVLVIACPCAMGLATPMAILVASSVAAKRGILLREPALLETLSNVYTVCFDKTGTLTSGEPTVDTIFDDAAEPSATSETHLLQLAASVEKYVQHPVAKAIVRKAKESGITLLPVSNLQQVPGLGAQGKVEGKQVVVGHPRLFEQLAIDMQDIEPRMHDLLNSGRSCTLVAIDGNCAGLIAVTDTIRPEAPAAVGELRKLGLEVCMITGDAPEPAQVIASHVGITDISARMSPEGKLEDITSRQQRGKVVFVGDGVNDGPALAAADVGLTFASASDIAQFTAPITIIHHDLTRIPVLIKLARDTVATIKQNLVWAFVYNFLALPLAALGMVPPAVAAGAMMASSISVILNSLRLRRSQ